MVDNGILGGGSTIYSKRELTSLFSVACTPADRADGADISVEIPRRLRNLRESTVVSYLGTFGSKTVMIVSLHPKQSLFHWI